MRKRGASTFLLRAQLSIAPPPWPTKASPPPHHHHAHLRNASPPPTPPCPTNANSLAGSRLTVTLWHGLYDQVLDAWELQQCQQHQLQQRQQHQPQQHQQHQQLPSSCPRVGAAEGRKAAAGEEAAAPTNGDQRDRGDSRGTRPAAGNVVGTCSAPHLVIAPNAGLPAFPSWLPSLQRLLAGRARRTACVVSGGTEARVGEGCGGRGIIGEVAAARTRGVGSSGGRSTGTVIGSPNVGRSSGSSCDGDNGGRRCMGTPFLATDYCEEAVHQSLKLLQSLEPGCCNVLGELNPFRQPYPTSRHGTALPACSNALLFGWV